MVISQLLLSFFNLSSRHLLSLIEKSLVPQRTGEQLYTKDIWAHPCYIHASLGIRIIIVSLTLGAAVCSCKSRCAVSEVTDFLPRITFYCYSAGEGFILLINKQVFEVNTKMKKNWNTNWHILGFQIQMKICLSLVGLKFYKILHCQIF